VLEDVALPKIRLVKPVIFLIILFVKIAGDLENIQCPYKEKNY